MRIYIFGSNGMLGNYITSYLSQYYDICALTRNDYDLSKLTISSLEKMLLHKSLKKDDVIINCAGVIPQASKQRSLNSKLYFTINSLFPIILSQLCDKYNAKMIHITTDCVFSGKDGLYNELSEHDETNDYGMSKSLLEWVKSNRDKEINGYTNHFWNGVTCLELSKIIYKIIDENLHWHGIRHIFSPRSVSKFELVSMINEVYNLNIKIKPFETEKVDKTITSVYETNSLFNVPDLKMQIVEIIDYVL